MLRSIALALVAAASTEAFMAPAAWTSAPVSNRAVAKSGLSSLQMKVGTGRRERERRRARRAGSIVCRNTFSPTRTTVSMS